MIPVEIAILVGLTVVVFAEFCRWAWRAHDRHEENGR